MKRSQNYLRVRFYCCYRENDSDVGTLLLMSNSYMEEFGTIEGADFAFMATSANQLDGLAGEFLKKERLKRVGNPFVFKASEEKVAELILRTSGIYQ